MLEVEASKYAADLVDRSTDVDAGVFAEVGQAALLKLDGCRLVDDPQFFDRLLIGDLFAVKPEQFTQCGGIELVGLFLTGVFGLNQDKSLAAEVFEHFEQPVVEAADFDDRPVAAVFLEASLGQPLKELKQFVWPGADLSSQNNVAILISQVDG